MFSSLLRSLYQGLGVRSLRAKVFLPSIALALASVFVGTIIVLGGNYLARRSWFEQQISTSADEVIETMSRRTEAVSSAGRSLAEDLDVAHALQEGTEAARLVLDERAHVVRDRFDLALVQIYDEGGLLQMEVLPSTVCFEDAATVTLLHLAETGRVVARAVDDQVLLLHRAPVSAGGGTVVVGLDLEAELRRMRTMNGITTGLGVALRGTHVGTVPALVFDAQGGWIGDQYSRKQSIVLGATPAELVLVRSGGDVKWVTRATVVIAVGSMLFATLLLGGLNVGLVGSVERRLGILSAAAHAVREGDLEQEVRLKSNALTIGQQDELGRLVDSFDEMISGLRGLCCDLEAQVEAHAAGLAIAAGVSRAASSSLELDTILRRSAKIMIGNLGRICPGVYHVGVFLVERGSDTVGLQEVASEAREDVGRRSVRVPVGSKSPVGLAVATKEAKVVQDVRLMPAHLK